MHENEIILPDRIFAKHRDLFDFCNKLIVLADISFKNFTKKGDSIPRIPYNDYFLQLSCKAFKSFQAINLLAQNGFSQDETTLVRILFETYVNLKWLKENPQEHTLIFEYDWHEARNKWIKSLFENNNNPEHRANLVAKQNKYKNEFDAFKEENPNISQMPNFFERCRTCNCIHLYDQLYRPYSQNIHGKLGALKTHFEKRDKDIRLDCTPSEVGVDKPLADSFKIFIRVVEIFHAEYQILEIEQQQMLEKMLSWVKDFGEMRSD